MCDDDHDLYIIGAVCLWRKRWLPLLFVLPRWLVRFIYNRSCLSDTKKLTPLLFVLPRWLVRFIYNRSCLSVWQLAASPLFVFCPGLAGSVGSSLLYIFYEIAIFYDDKVLGFLWIQINRRMYYMEECRWEKLHKSNYFPPSWAPQARSEAWDVYPCELYPPDDPPRPSRPKAGLGLVMMMMMMMMMMMPAPYWPSFLVPTEEARPASAWQRQSWRPKFKTNFCIFLNKFQYVFLLTEHYNPKGPQKIETTIMFWRVKKIG